MSICFDYEPDKNNKVSRIKWSLQLFVFLVWGMMPSKRVPSFFFFVVCSTRRCLVLRQKKSASKADYCVFGQIVPVVFLVLSATACKWYDFLALWHIFISVYTPVIFFKCAYGCMLVKPQLHMFVTFVVSVYITPCLQSAT